MGSGMGAMRSKWMALIILAAVVGAFATDSLSDNVQYDQHLARGVDEGNAGGNDKPLLLCCDKCGICTKSIPPMCTCLDNWLLFCPPWCRKCQPTPPMIYPPRYQCMDLITNYCKQRCTPKPLGSE